MAQQVRVTQSVAWAQTGRPMEVVVEVMGGGMAVVNLPDFIQALQETMAAWTQRRDGRTVVG